MDAMYGYTLLCIQVEHCREGIGDRLKVSNANERNGPGAQVSEGESA